MSDRLQNARNTFGLHCFITFEGALNALLAPECPKPDVLCNRQALVAAIAELVATHFPSCAHMAQGQIRWTAV